MLIVASICIVLDCYLRGYITLPENILQFNITRARTINNFGPGASQYNYNSETPSLIQEEDFIENSSISDKLAEHSKNQITRLKNSGKYIPNIFVEISKVKDQARYFTHPVLFFQRSIEDIEKINLNQINRLLSSIEKPNMDISISDDLQSGSTVEEISSKASEIVEILDSPSSLAKMYADFYFEKQTIEGLDGRNEQISQEMRFALGQCGSQVSRDIENLISQFKLFHSKVLILLANAGQGKTNFLCDFIENCLLKRNIPTIFFTGQDLSLFPSSDLAVNILGSGFDSSTKNIEFMLEKLNELGIERNVPVIIAIDGINESQELQTFAFNLEQFIEKVVGYSNIRVLLTCREEYFEERFSNLEKASFSNEVQIYEHFNHKINRKHKQKMLEGYFDFFNLKFEVFADKAREILIEDPLLLRMFCESYGDNNSEKKINLGQVYDIHRHQIFSKYLDKKLDNVVEMLPDQSGTGLGRKTRLNSAINKVLQKMVENKDFTKLELAEIDLIYHSEISLLIGEGIFLKGLSEEGLMGSRPEVIGFTFDEFRDYLIARYLLEQVYDQDTEQFDQLIDELVVSNSQIAEGLRKYLFLTSRQYNDGRLTEIISAKEWYEKTFIENIFSISDSQITQSDKDEIKRQFLIIERTNEFANYSFTTRFDAPWIIYSLVMRYNIERYSNLNIHLLFEILETLNQDQFDEFFSQPIGGKARPFLHDGIRSWVAKDIIEDVNDYGFIGFSEAIFELLIYFTGIYEYQTSEAAFMTLKGYGRAYPQELHSLLSKHLDTNKISIEIQVWRLLKEIKEHIPSLDTKAFERLSEISTTEDKTLRRLKQEIERYTES